MKLDMEKDRNRVTLLLVERTGTDKLRRESNERLEISENKGLKIKTLFSIFLRELRVGREISLSR